MAMSRHDPTPLLVFVLFFCKKGECGVKIWKYDVDITNPSNWENHGNGQDCKGTIFAPFNTAPITIDRLYTKQLTLPRNGEINLFDGSLIQFTANSKCVRLKPLDYKDWFDYDNWQSDSNSATPDLEKIPCESDEIQIPKGYSSRISLEQVSDVIPTIRSMKFANLYKGNWFLRTVMSTPEGSKVFRYDTGADRTLPIRTNPIGCTEVTGCTCLSYSIPCPFHDDDVSPSRCLNPIEPHGFCRKICGSYITFKSHKNFDIEKFKKRLTEYGSDSHVSKIHEDLIQIVFSEREYSGSSLFDAEDFYDALKLENFNELTMVQSGSYYNPSGTVLGTILLLVGTLCLVLVVFGGLFYYYGETKFNLDFRRVHLRSGSLFTTPFFARFDNTDDHLVINESVVNLARSFDNPLFGTGGSTQGDDNNGEETASSDVADDDLSLTHLNGGDEKVNPLFDINLDSIGKSSVDEE